MTFSRVEWRLLELAAVGGVFEEPDSAPAVGAVYRRLDAAVLMAGEWWAEDALLL